MQSRSDDNDFPREKHNIDFCMTEKFVTFIHK